MKQPDNRIERIERQLDQVRAFIERDKTRLLENPKDRSAKQSLDSWTVYLDQLNDELTILAAPIESNEIEFTIWRDKGREIPEPVIESLTQDVAAALIMAAHYNERHLELDSAGLPPCTKEIIRETPVRVSLTFPAMPRRALEPSDIEAALSIILCYVRSATPGSYLTLYATIGARAWETVSKILDTIADNQLDVTFAIRREDRSYNRVIVHSDFAIKCKSIFDSVRKSGPTQTVVTGKILSIDGELIYLETEDGSLLKIFYRPSLYQKVNSLSAGDECCAQVLKFSPGGGQPPSYSLIC